MSKHLCPANIPNMGTPKTNPEVWELMPRGYQVADNYTQKVQQILAHALSAILEIITAIGSDTGGSTESHLRTLTDAQRLVTMGFSWLTQIRKELIRNCLGFPIAKFCTWESLVGTDLLFQDLHKKLKDRDETTFKLRRKKQFR